MNESNRRIFSGMQVLISKDNSLQWAKDQAVVVEEHSVKAIISIDMVKHHLPAKRFEFPEDHYLIPGFIDLHVHGAHGKDVMDATEEAYATICKSLASEGVTGYLATTMTADNEKIEAVLAAIPQAMTQSKGAAILGVHLEGPFLAKTKLGAQQGDFTQAPDAALFKRWQHLANDAIKLVTMAPELPGAIPFIQAMHAMGVITSIGHTDANYEQTQAAISAGATQATHIFNAMHGLYHREPGAVGALLLADNVTAEMIVDGFHLCPPIVKLVLRLKGKDRIVLVTDAMRGKCLGDGSYDLGGQCVNVSAGKATLADGTLAGSTLRMPKAIKNMVEYSLCSLPEAIGMATLNPARTLGIDARKGSIGAGKDADLVVMDGKLGVVMTMVGGVVVFKAEEAGSSKNGIKD
jgi:N-acetylglucosamine-6-phosphate deacetylase